MAIIFNEASKTFHLTNGNISYLMTIMENNQLGHLYFGKSVTNSPDFSHMLVERSCILAPCAFKGNLDFSLEVLKQEYPAYGTGDFREPAYQLEQENGSCTTNFVYHSHNIYKGKKKLDSLPQTRCKNEEEVETLEINLVDQLIGCTITLNYHIFAKHNSIVRSTTFTANTDQTIKINRALSLSVDFYDDDYEMLTLDGAWSRERHITTRPLASGINAISSTRGTSSATHNPYMALKRPNTTEHNGEAYGFSFIYSGNFLASAQVDCYDVTRVMLGINPFQFSWTLEKSGDTFQTPEAVMSYSDNGLNGLSQTFHNLYRENLMGGPYAGKTRPILINNWEATYFDFTEESILTIAKKAKDLGVELFVLDDGWFGKRDNDTTSLGDWTAYLAKLPNGVSGLCQKINELGLKFGLWFEPEMVNEVSNLYSTHPDWVIQTPNREKSYGRNQFVLDFSRDDVVNYIFDIMCQTLDTANISYIKWDMNRNITEAFSPALPPSRQQEFFHRYILGVYKLYEKLTSRYPEILFESCASGGARFDPGMLYYAPQAWASDDTDAVERLHIQYGTSMVYPIVSMGSHVAAIPNHQVERKTNLAMRANVAYFGTFGYELDLNKMTDEERAQVSKQIQFFKQYRDVIQLGDFYRLKQGNYYSWIAVSKDKKTAILGYYKILATPNPSLKKIQLVGLDPALEYTCNNKDYHGDQLMNFGMVLETEFTGLLQGENFKGKYTPGTDKGDFTSQLYVFTAK